MDKKTNEQMSAAEATFVEQSRDVVKNAQAVHGESFGHYILFAAHMQQLLLTLNLTMNLIADKRANEIDAEKLSDVIRQSLDCAAGAATLGCGIDNEEKFEEAIKLSKVLLDSSKASYVNSLH